MLFFGGADPNFTNGGFTTEDEFNLFDLDEEGGAVLFRVFYSEPEIKRNKTVYDHLEMNATAASYEVPDNNF